MIFKLRLDDLAVRTATVFTGLACCVWLGTLVQGRYIVSTLTDEGAKALPATLAAAASRFPASARLQAQLATVTLARALEDDESLAQSEAAAARAVLLSPHNVNFRLLLAATQSVSGAVEAQEEHLRAAVALAPSYPRVRWQLANLLVRAGKIQPALPEFRQALTAERLLLPAALELLWEVSGGDVQTLSQATGETPENSLSLAQFLFQQGRLAEATQIFNQVAKPARLAAPQSAELLNGLLTGGQPELARRLWCDLLGQANDTPPLIWNSSFEAQRLPGLTLFDWQLSRSEYALAAIEPTAVRTGERALRLDFYGRDTTRLSDEVKQLVVLRPGARYRLEGYAKAVRLVMPEGPRLAVLNHASGQVVAATEPVSAATSE